jgi:type IV pilus assembly protein PilM
MASKLPVWGIDLGQCSLKAMKLQGDAEQVELLAFDLIEHEQILSQAEADTNAMIIKAIETFVSRNDLSNSRIVVSVPGQQTLTRFTKMPPVEPKKLPSMVQYEASQQIPFDMDEVVWDYQVFTDEETAEVEVGIFAIRKELIRSYLSRFTDAGIEPFIVQASPMASYNTARFESTLPEGEAAVMLDMGALATDLIVIEGERIWSRPIPLGGNRFTEALVSAFKIPFRKAERLKRNAASSKYARQIFHAMRPVFADLVSEVQRSIGFYTSTHREAHITRVIGMGNAFKLPGLQKFLQQNLQIKAEKLSSFRHLKVTSTGKHEEFQNNVMSLGVAYGLALQGLGLAKVESNLLPLEIRRSLLWSRKRTWFAASAACLALTAGALWMGNVMAGNALASGLGSISPEAIRLRNFGTPEQAMQALDGLSQSAPAVEQAIIAGGAAQKLTEAYNQAGRVGGDSSTLKMLARIPENNVFVSRILDVIHKAFEDVTPPEVKSIKTAEAYKRFAEETPRRQRKEIWIEELAMGYSLDPKATLSSEAGKQVAVKRGQQGWYLVITGITTERNPAKWLEENLVKALERRGRAPDQGLFVESATLTKVSERGKPKKRGISSPTDDGLRGGGRGGRGGRGPGDGLPTGGGPGGGLPTGGGGGGRGGPGGSAPPADSGNDLRDWEKTLETVDPLTREEVKNDYRFVLQVVVRKRNTPAEQIPDEYKPKKDEEQGDPKGTDQQS